MNRLAAVAAFIVRREGLVTAPNRVVASFEIESGFAVASQLPRGSALQGGGPEFPPPCNVVTDCLFKESGAPFFIMPLWQEYLKLLRSKRRYRRRYRRVGRRYIRSIRAVGLGRRVARRSWRTIKSGRRRYRRRRQG